MFCSNCGNELQNGAEFCSKCGCAVNQPQEAVQGLQQVNNYKTNAVAQEQDKKAQTTTKEIIAFICVIIVVFGFVSLAVIQKSGGLQEAETTKHTIPATTLASDLSGLRYSVGPFSITLGTLVDKAMTDYEIEYLQGEEIIQNGYLSSGSINSESSVDNCYCVIISGNAMQNPELTYLTQYEEKAVVAVLQYNDNDELVDASLQLCENLQTCAILITTGS